MTAIKQGPLLSESTISKIKAPHLVKQIKNEMIRHFFIQARRQAG
jgi:hypothetical protein